MYTLTFTLFFIAVIFCCIYCILPNSLIYHKFFLYNSFEQYYNIYTTIDTLVVPIYDHVIASMQNLCNNSLVQYMSSVPASVSSQSIWSEHEDLQTDP